MIEVTLTQFKVEPEHFVLSALSTGNIVTINAGKEGNAILMEEAEYKVMREALEALLIIKEKK